LYSFVWEDFCAFYLEVAKPGMNVEISEELYHKTLEVYERICIVLHPFMPFITEEIWHGLKERKVGEDCMVSNYPKWTAPEKLILSNMQEIRSVITQVRELRNKNQVKMQVPVPLFIMHNDQGSLLDVEGATDILKKTAALSEVKNTDTEISGAQSFLGMRDKYYLVLPVTLDVESEKNDLIKEIEYNEGFIASVNKKLENPRFVSSAPPELVENEKKKLLDGQSRLKALQERLASV
jgi:valyl-tRNA synthetase